MRKRAIILVLLALCARMASVAPITELETAREHLIHVIRVIAGVLGLPGIAGYALNYFYGKNWDEGGSAHVRHQIFVLMIVSVCWPLLSTGYNDE